VQQIRQSHDRVVLDWGFRVSYVSWVEQLRDQDVRLIWFDGDADRAREAFVRRGGSDATSFDRQVVDIQQAGYPESLRCSVVPAMSASGIFLNQHEIERIVFQ
jgi:hypothetical protein